MSQHLTYYLMDEVNTEKTEPRLNKYTLTEHQTPICTKKTFVVFTRSKKIILVLNDHSHSSVKRLSDS